MAVSGDKILVGFSGGADSVALLLVLYKLKELLGTELVAVHVNHGIREEAGEDADFTRRFCEERNIRYYLVEEDVPGIARENKLTEEEAGRNVRYKAFRTIAEKEGAAKIAVAHHRNDVAETLLLNLLRGTGLHGAGAIRPVRDNVIRPLLCVTRQEIEEYLGEEGISFCHDATNDENIHTRNKVRNELIPYLEKNYNPNIRSALRRYAELADLDDSLLNEIALNAMEGHIAVEHDPDRILLDITDIRNNPVPVNTRIAWMILQMMRLEKFSTFELITQITSLIYSLNPSGSADLPEGARAYREYDTVIFAASCEEMDIQPDTGLRMVPQVIMRKDYHPDDEYMYAAFDFDEFNKAYPGRVGELKLRTRQEGDYLPMKKGSKKIQDLLVDSKVMKRARSSILMVAIDSEVLWILPSKYFAGRQEQEKGRFSPKYHITEDTERVLFIEIAEDI